MTPALGLCVRNWTPVIPWGSALPEFAQTQRNQIIPHALKTVFAKLEFVLCLAARTTAMAKEIVRVDCVSAMKVSKGLTVGLCVRAQATVPTMAFVMKANAFVKAIIVELTVRLRCVEETETAISTASVAMRSATATQALLAMIAPCRLAALTAAAMASASLVCVSVMQAIRASSVMPSFLVPRMAISRVEAKASVTRATASVTRVTGETLVNMPTLVPTTA